MKPPPSDINPPIQTAKDRSADGKWTGAEWRRGDGAVLPLLALTCLALALFVGGCVSPAPEEPEDNGLGDRAKQLIVEDASVVITSGTATLRHIRASRAVFHEDTRYLEASSLTLTLNIPDRNIGITAHASRGEVFLATAKDKEKAGRLVSANEGKDALEKLSALGEGFAADPTRPVGLEEMKRLAYLPRDQRSFGDVVLFGPVTGETSDGGEFHTQTVFWSESMKRLMVPNPFYQKIYAPNGGVGEIDAGAFEVDSTLRHWVYYADTQPGEIVWDATGVEKPGAHPGSDKKEDNRLRSPAR